MEKGLLIITCLSKIASSLALASKNIRSSLYIHYQPSEPVRLDKISKALATIYTCSIEHNIKDARILISTIKNQTLICAKLRAVNYFQVDDKILSPACGYSPTNCTLEANQCSYNNVVLGGTFDRMHIGHKILLSEAALRANQRLVVGVTDVNMIKTKKLSELMFPLEKRIYDVKEFLHDIDDTLNCEVIPIQDPFGPTATDPNMDLIVVSTETMKGGEKVNEIRRKNQLNQLELYCIPLVEIEEAIKEKEKKVSSSNQRMDMLGSQFKEPFDRPNLAKKPYIIGLIGGIASGKSKMTERFQKMGAGIIDCDKLAHSLYDPGEKCYQAIIDEFGFGIVDKDGSINRKNLGSIVFSDPEKLQALNKIVWPNLLEKANGKIQHIYEHDKREIIILEAAILLQAGWETECHEIWACIIPPDIAVQRIIERNNLTEDEAKARIASQMSNDIIVAHSNVVFSSLWSYEYSQLQAEKAWKELLLRLRNSKV